MVKTVLKIDGMSCSMCEAHMNEVIRNNFKVNKVSSSASAGETVIISDAELDIPWHLLLRVLPSHDAVRKRSGIPLW